MAASVKRIGVLLSQEHYDLVSRIAAHQRSSRSLILRELFEAVAPVFDRMDKLFRAAKAAGDSVKAGLAESAEQAEREMAPLVAEALGVFDEMEAQLKEVEAAGRGLPAAPAVGGPRTRRRPPLANQGGQVTKNVRSRRRRS